MRIALVTAGGAGMFCGSCMQDNTLARSLIAQGADVTLIPTYTPIRVDEENASLNRVFFGGLNVYLNSRWKMWRYLPRFMQRWVDHPAVIRWATSMAVSNDAKELGDLTLSMLTGAHGPHRQAGAELASYIAEELQPDVVIFSNALLSGVVEQLREHFGGVLLCTLQGDDIFLDGLPNDIRHKAIELISQNSVGFDGFLTHSRFYQNYIADYLKLPTEKFRMLPLGIDLTGHTGQPKPPVENEFTVGYFARIAPEKGLHHLAEAFVDLRKRVPHANLRIGGFLPPQHQDYLNHVTETLRGIGIEDAYIGSPPDHEGKVEFLKSIDVLCVPTDFLEPKGIYVLEAMANGVPVVQPAHGAFPELLEATSGGKLFTPRDPLHLSKTLEELAEHSVRFEHAQRGWQGVRDRHSAEVAARATMQTLDDFMQGRRT
ncbi:MAG: glycosyltransferase family 4 protein [Planctomycetaceae bacterium]|nr:glycosyltransferase family 4 protein [Planctomycetaceae bacterium]